jgi:hypothetical protein
MPILPTRSDPARRTIDQGSFVKKKGVGQKKPVPFEINVIKEVILPNPVGGNCQT